MYNIKIIGVLLKQCTTCKGTGFIKYEPKVCVVCKGIKCMSCNSIGYDKMPWDLCNKCDGDGEIKKPITH
jgi:DnaJ-class molecular chaperone